MKMEYKIYNQMGKFLASYGPGWNLADIMNDQEADRVDTVIDGWVVTSVTRQELQAAIRRKKISMKQIRLYKSPEGIMAEFTVDGRPDRSVRAVMETHIIPTGDTRDASLVDAGYVIGRRFPGYAVTYWID